MKKFSLTLFLLVILLAACGGPADEGVVVTFLVADREEYKIQITDPAKIETARKLLAVRKPLPFPMVSLFAANQVSMTGIPGILIPTL